MVKVYYSPPGRRNTTRFLLEQAVRSCRPPDYSTILYLAPSPVKADDAQKTFHEMQDTKCYLPPLMTTIRGYCKRMYSAGGTKRVLPKPLIPVILSGLSGKGLGFSGLAADFIHDLKQLCPGAEAGSIRLTLEGIFNELNVPESVAAGILQVLGIFAGYQRFSSGNGLIDEGDIMSDIPKILGDPRTARHPVLVLDGFYDVSVSEREVLKALIRNSADAHIAVPRDQRFYGLIREYAGFLKEHFPVEETYLEDGDEPLPFIYYAYSDVEEEIEGIARSIKSLCIAGKIEKLDDAAVVFPDLFAYRSMVERVFRRYGIPCDIAAGTELGKTRPVLDMLCLLESAAEGYPRLKFSQFLASKYFTAVPGSLRKWIPSISPQSGVVSGKSAWLDFVAEGSETLDMRLLDDRQAIQEDLEWVFRKLEPLEDLRSGASLGTHAGTLRKVILDLGFPGPLHLPLPEGSPEQASASPVKKIFKAVEDILEQVSFLGGLNPAPVSLAEFAEVLRHLIRSAALDSEGSGVRVLGFADAGGLSPLYLYFGGLVDGKIPARLDMDYILPDNVKMRLGLPHLEKFNAVQKFAFSDIIRSCKHLHLSYPLMDGDTVFLPSSFLYSGEERREQLPGIFSKEEYLVRSGGEPLLDSIAEIRLDPAKLPHFLQKGEGAFLRVTDIDAYRACPRRFFIEKGLSLAPVAIKEYEIEAATLGTIVHKVMEKLVREPLRDIGCLQARAGEILDETMKDKRMDAYWKRLIRDTFIELLPAIYEKEIEIRGEGYVSTEVEKPVSGEPVKGIRLKGKIDRMDTLGDGVQIIDYKTGAPGLNCTQILNGNEDLQLFLYAAIMKEHGHTVSRVGIYSLKDMDIKWCPPKRKTKGKGAGEGGCSAGEYIEASLTHLQEAVARMRKGDFSARPLTDTSCWNCHEYAFCPYIQQ